MSEPISALKGARFEGIACVEEQGLQGMITLRGDLSHPSVIKAAETVTGQEMPGLRAARVIGESGLCWMSPDELLVLVPHSEVEAKLAEMQKLLGDAHALVANVSDARAVFAVSGEAAREVLGKLAPVDLSAAAFGPGEIRRTRLAQVAAAFWMDGEDSFRVVCFRSTAEYVFKVLKAAAQPGSGVGIY